MFTAFAVFFLAMALPMAYGSSAVRDLAIQEVDWTMQDPVITYDSVSETFTAKVVNGGAAATTTTQQNARIKISYWDTCPHGEHIGELSAAQDPIDIGGQAWLTNTLAKSFSVSTGANTASFPFKINPTAASGFSGYTAGTNTATIEFCMKIWLEKSPGGWVNFREIILTAVYDLTGNFDVLDTFETQALNPTNDALDDIEYAMIVTDCGSGLYNQGDTICVEVCPESTQVEVTSFISMTVTQKIQGTADEDTQDIWDSSTEGDLTIGSTCASDCCKTTFKLRGNFYPFSETVVKNDVKGEVALIFSRRGLKEGERILEETTAKFETAVFTTQPHDSASVGAATTAAAAGGILGAAALLL